MQSAQEFIYELWKKKQEWNFPAVCLICFTISFAHVDFFSQSDLDMGLFSRLEYWGFRWPSGR